MPTAEGFMKWPLDGLSGLWEGGILWSLLYLEVWVGITGRGAPFQKWLWLLNCFYFPLVYHQDISPFHGDFLKRSHSHFRKLSSCWMTMIASFSGWQPEATAVWSKQKEGARLLSWPRPEGKSSLQWWYSDCGKISSMEEAIRRRSIKALLEQPRGKEASSVTSSGLTGKALQNTLDHPTSVTFPVHF